MPENDGVKSVRVRVMGVVQGVGFRFFTHRVAVSLGLFGYVRNMPDGSVEAVAEGNPQMIDEFLEKIGTGPSVSRVREIRISEIPPADYSEFEARF